MHHIADFSSAKEKHNNFSTQKNYIVSLNVAYQKLPMRTRAKSFQNIIDLVLSKRSHAILARKVEFDSNLHTLRRFVCVKVG